jgi:hypothetical protein
MERTHQPRPRTQLRRGNQPGSSQVTTSPDRWCPAAPSRTGRQFRYKAPGPAALRVRPAGRTPPQILAAALRPARRRPHQPPQLRVPLHRLDPGPARPPGRPRRRPWRAAAAGGRRAGDRLAAGPHLDRHPDPRAQPQAVGRRLPPLPGLPPGRPRPAAPTTDRPARRGARRPRRRRRHPCPAVRAAAGGGRMTPTHARQPGRRDTPPA